MSGIVTVSVGSPFPLRVEDAGYERSIELGAFAVANEKGVLELKHFKDEMDQDAPLQIRGVGLFEKSNPIHKHNLNMLQLFLDLNPELNKELFISDPEVEIEAEFRQSAMAFEVESYIRKNERNVPLLAKLHRRILGSVKGIIDKVVFNTLTTLAKNDPEKFVVKGKYVYEDKSFETLALIDSCVEKGLLSIDQDGTVKDKDGRIFAQDIDRAAFYLESNEPEMAMFQRLVGDREPDQTRYVPTIETSSLVEIKTDSGNAAATNFNGEANPEVLLAEIKGNIPKLVEEGFFERTGQGPTTRYNFPGIPTPVFTKSELADHFVKNMKQYEDFKLRANL